jgi:uncharacterized membrane protein HdeD (DUF308 family)
MSTMPVTVRSVESMWRHAGWATVLRGILAVAFGIIALRSPHVAIKAFVIVFAVWAFADGLVDFATAARLGRAGHRWGWYLFEGVVSVAIGVIALAAPGITFLALVFYVGLRAIILGFIEGASAFSWAGHQSRWLLGVAGVLSLVMGILLLVSPVAGGLALVWVIGLYAVVIGIALFAHGLHMISVESRERREREPLEPPMHGAPPPVAAS